MRSVNEYRFSLYRGFFRLIKPLVGKSKYIIGDVYFCICDTPVRDSSLIDCRIIHKHKSWAK